MDEFDIYLQSTASMQSYQDSRATCFCNVLSEPLQLYGDWRVLIAGLLLPSKKTIKNYLIYTLRTAKQKLSDRSRLFSPGVIVYHPDFSSNATFPYGKIENTQSISKLLKKHTVISKQLMKASCQKETVELEFAKGFGICVRHRSLLDALGLSGVQASNRVEYFIRTQSKVRN